MAKGLLRLPYTQEEFVFWHGKDSKVYFGTKSIIKGREVYHCLIEFTPDEYERLVGQGLEPIVEDRGSFTKLV